VSRSSIIDYRGRTLWVHTEGLQVWLALLVEAGSELEARHEPWFRELLEHWKVEATVADLGCTLDDAWSVEQEGVVAGLARHVQRHLEPGIEPRPGWSVLDGHPVAWGVGERNLLLRMAEVADGFIHLIDGTLPPDPLGGWWGVGWGRDRWEVILLRTQAW
jgi:hypothetical protein